jgi:sugar porter (SP) family MFS transporter
MAGGAATQLATTSDVNRIEAPVTVKAYLMCAFASFGGIFFGFDSGYISGVLAMNYFIHLYQGLPYPPANATTDQLNAFTLPAWKKSLITSILSCGTFFGALIAGDLADWFGRRTTIIIGCFIFIVGVILQTASTALGLLVAGRLIAGFGVGFVSAIIILYMSEIAPKKVRGALVSGYQFCITIGILLASCVDYGTQNRLDTGSYRIPMALQMLWAIILGTGLFLLPESPRYFVKKGNLDKAIHVLTQLRGQPEGSEYIQQELAEIVANNEYEMSVIPQTGYFGSWFACFTGGFTNPSSNLRRTILGISLQMMQQWTGINFIFYFGTTFFKELGTISNPFLISLVTTLVNVCSTPISFYIIEKWGRRTIMIGGAMGMVVCEFIVGIIGVTAGRLDRPNHGPAVRSQIAFICFYIFFFATTWGPGKRDSTHIHSESSIKN